MKVAALAGGVGGARLLDGLASALPADDLVAVVNTGDDFEHLGLWISPDLDTVLYTLAGEAAPKQGWGLANESFRALERIERLGGPAWFRLGDRDLGLHLLRSTWRREGIGLAAITDRLRRALGVGPRVLPMAEEPRPTILETDRGTLSFQDWLVRARGAPRVWSARSEGTTTPAPGVLDALLGADVVVSCPSNPYVSIDPILGLDHVRAAVAGRPVVAVSPIVGGRAVKGPLAAMIPTIGGEAPSAAAVARHYGPLLTGMVVERGDGAAVDVPVYETATVMGDRADRTRLAREVLSFAETL